MMVLQTNVTCEVKINSRDLFYNSCNLSEMCCNLLLSFSFTLLWIFLSVYKILMSMNYSLYQLLILKIANAHNNSFTCMILYVYFEEEMGYSLHILYTLFAR